MDTVGAVCSGHSRIVVYGGGDIVFDTKRSNQWMQCAVDAVSKLLKIPRRQKQEYMIV